MYDNYDGDIKKTVQNHHWIEQCVLKKTTDYPFLKHPPMDYDLFTSEKNLSLIVGHNGPHSPEYTKNIVDKLKTLDESLTTNFGEIWKSLIESDDEIKRYINSYIERIINQLKNEVTRHKELINSSKEIFIIG